MVDFVIVAILVIVIGSALAYIMKERKKGVKCIGCPEGCHACKSAGDVTSTCGSGSKANTSCSCQENRK